jgi:hypothetical protein
VVTATVLVGLGLAFHTALAAGKLHTRYGFAIEAERWWARGGILYYERRGVTQAIPRSDVLRIEGQPDPPGTVAVAPPSAVPRFCRAGTPPVVTRGDLGFMARMEEALARVTDESAREAIAHRLATCTRFMHQALNGERPEASDLRAYCCP